MTTVDDLQTELPAEGTPEYRALTDGVIAEFRARGGTVGGMLDGVALLLLTTIGAKSGVARTNPLTYLTDGHRLLVVAAKEGDVARHPDWYANLRANPEVTIELGREMFPARAVTLTGAEREAQLARFVAELPPAFAPYLQKSHLEIPVIALERRR